MKFTMFAVLSLASLVNSFQPETVFQLSHKNHIISRTHIRSDRVAIFAKTPDVVKFSPEEPTITADIPGEMINDAFAKAPNLVKFSPAESATAADNDAAFAEADSIFDTIDINKDGGISNAELQAHLVILGYSKDSIRYLFTALDSNADGVISREEMRFAFANYESTALYMSLGLGNEVTNDAFNDAVGAVRSSAKAGNTLSKKANNELADLIFDMIDTDKSGEIDSEELKKHFRVKGNSTWQIGNFSANSVESILEALDIDFDGTISREEMREGFNQYDPRALAKALGLRVFRTAEI
mmetsp:Transcript_38491/g.89488  ORF Transcript_38491/g.89488 Transcript_38491/m.89488 type:complete len:298 (-) Transcript_38491:286-1179(-)|eukprot:CAMPEP_0113314070 /NCGR_PEP_ID=MMETSP0010_2-20120614/10270_1 /TAXON_ID=216773 ORGANISM="Corethron hystrix, Strain 308" /NCGR_SAMPLE_ID=MMETSP0010_2 /ASSEMBLY_ACC=CAM_ASM_000155 /LENGTH=297 /DNA_ID=CAMNT_0000170267 /DNA_START=142 /DNA_END=1035 /DNA_ORIENTATION=- /assembly_acc=CAM_ASM_000155